MTTTTTKSRLIPKSFMHNKTTLAQWLAADIHAEPLPYEIPAELGSLRLDTIEGVDCWALISETERLIRHLGDLLKPEAATKLRAAVVAKCKQYAAGLDREAELEREILSAVVSY